MVQVHPVIPFRGNIYTYRSKVENIVDGDTIDLFVDLGFETWKHVRIRLADIDTPETRTTDLIEKAAGLAAKEYVVSRIPVGTEVRLISTSYDKYGRVLGYIWLLDSNGQMLISINDELLNLGYAKPYGS